MKKNYYAIAGLMTLIAAGSALPGNAQVLPTSIDRSQTLTDARSLGMGGADLIVATGAAAAAANPAAVGQAGNWSATLQGAGRSNNINASDIHNLADGLRDLRTEADTGIGKVTNVRTAFNTVYNFAAKAGAALGGGPAKITGTGNPLFGFTFKNYGLVAYSSVVGDSRIAITGTTTGTRTIAANASGIGLTSVAVPMAFPLKCGTIGVSPKIIRADFAGLTANASEITNTITSAGYKRVNDQKFDVDLGYISNPDPKRHFQYAAVVHDLFAPAFKLAATQVNGQLVTPAIANFNFTQNPQIDLGGLFPTKTITYAAEIHNITAANNGSATVHLGGEYKVNTRFAVRAGLDQDKVVAGFGIIGGPVHFDLAVSTNPQERFALNLSTGM